MISDHIKAALANWSGLPMEWGVSDCAMATADIYVSAGLPDPVASFRGRYATKIGAYRKLGRGGLLAAVTALGWPETTEPVDGDLGLMQTPEGPACVIYYMGFWVGRVDGGFAAYGPSTPFMMWSAPCLKQ